MKLILVTILDALLIVLFLLALVDLTEGYNFFRGVMDNAVTQAFKL